jgi:hypothetical protein
VSASGIVDASPGRQGVGAVGVGGEALPVLVREFLRGHRSAHRRPVNHLLRRQSSRLCRGNHVSGTLRSRHQAHTLHVTDGSLTPIRRALSRHTPGARSQRSAERQSAFTKKGENAPSFMAGRNRPPRLTNICSSEYAVFAVSRRRPMPYKQTSRQCVVRLLALRGLSAAQRSQCQGLRAEAGRLRTPLDGSGDAVHADPRRGAVAQRRRLGAGDQRRPVCAAQPECAGALPEVRHQRGYGDRAPQAGVGRVRMHSNGLSASPQSLPDGGLEGSGAHRLALWLSAPAHRLTAATAAAAVACRVPQSQPAPGRDDLAGGPL